MPTHAHLPPLSLSLSLSLSFHALSTGARLLHHHGGGPRGTSARGESSPAPYAKSSWPATPGCLISPKQVYRDGEFQTPLQGGSTSRTPNEEGCMLHGEAIHRSIQGRWRPDESQDSSDDPKLSFGWRGPTTSPSCGHRHKGWLPVMTSDLWTQGTGTSSDLLPPEINGRVSKPGSFGSCSLPNHCRAVPLSGKRSPNQGTRGRTELSAASAMWLKDRSPNWERPWEIWGCATVK